MFVFQDDVLEHKLTELMRNFSVLLSFVELVSDQLINDGSLRKIVLVRASARDIPRHVGYQTHNFILL